METVLSLPAANSEALMAVVIAILTDRLLYWKEKEGRREPWGRVWYGIAAQDSTELHSVWLPDTKSAVLCQSQKEGAFTLAACFPLIVKPCPITW